MTRFTAISAALLISFGAFGTSAHASCTEEMVGGSPVLTCSSPGNAPVTDNRDGLSVVVEADAGIASDTRNAPPLNLGGNGQFVTNDGLIQNTDTRNNTDAIAVYGSDLSIVNNGEIRSGDRAIQVLGGDGGLTVENHGEIHSRRQAIRALEDIPGTTVINHGLIESIEGRALQIRGEGSRVINHGTMIGGEEVVEARDNFYMENYGNIILRDGVVDEDGVQFASGELHNHGLIQGSDDGVDLDQGLVHNYATGRIISTGDNSVRDSGGIDVDPVFDNGRDPVVPAGPLRIVNEGYIEGPRAIVTAEGSTSSVDVVNSGTLLGRSGVAIDFAPTQGDSTLTLTGNSLIYGDVLFGGGDDQLIIDSLDAGAILAEGLFDGGEGVNLVFFASYLVADLLSFVFDGTQVDLILGTGFDNVVGSFRNFDIWGFSDGQRFSTVALAALFSGPVAPVPTPATLPLLLTAIGGLWLTRRRRMI